MTTLLATEKMQEALSVVSDCAQTCEACAQRCMSDPSMLNCARLCLDSATVCNAMIVLLARDSKWYRSLTPVCAEVCDACASECEKFDDYHCRIVAQACRRCAEECRTLAA